MVDIDENEFNKIVGLHTKKKEACPPSVNPHSASPENVSYEDIRPLAEIERHAIEQAIRLCKGNIPRAAAFLDVSPSTLYRKMKSWHKKTCNNDEA